SLEPIDVTAAADVDNGTIATALDEEHVALRVGGVPVDVDADVGDEMRVGVPFGGEQRQPPGNEFVAPAEKLAVMVDGVLVVGGRVNLSIVAVEPSGVAVDAVGDRLPIEDVLDLGAETSELVAVTLVHPVAPVCRRGVSNR